MNSVVRMNITIPKTLLTELEKEVSVRGKSSFIKEAIEEKLRLERREHVLSERSSKAPTFLSIRDSSDYVSRMRKGEDRIREKKLNR